MEEKSFIRLTPVACFIKLIIAVIYGFRNELQCFVPGKLFQLSLMFVSKAGAYPSGTPF
jgi:hypothetical protein